MRHFVFLAADHYYAIGAACVQAVHPLVRARSIPGAPAWFVGVIDVHGELVPLVDAAMLFSGTTGVRRTMGARIILIDTGFEEGVRARFAIAVDRIEEVVDLDTAGAWGAATQSAAWLGLLLQHKNISAQQFDARVLASTFPQLAAVAAPLVNHKES